MRKLALYTLTLRLDRLQDGNGWWKRIGVYVLGGVAAIALAGQPMVSEAAEGKPPAGRATVKHDGAAVYADSRPTSTVVTVLRQGNVVTFEFALNGPEGAWCYITNAGRTKSTGYVRCEVLEREPSPGWRLQLPGVKVGPEPLDIRESMEKLEGRTEGETATDLGGRTEIGLASERGTQDLQQLYRELADIKEMLKRIAQAVKAAEE